MTKGEYGKGYYGTWLIEDINIKNIIKMDLHIPLTREYGDIIIEQQWPFEEVKSCIIEILNEIYTLTLFVTLIFLNTKEEWSSTKTLAFVWVLSSNSMITFIIVFSKCKAKICSWFYFHAHQKVNKKVMFMSLSVFSFIN